MSTTNGGLKSKLSGLFKSRASEAKNRHEMLVYSGFAGLSIANVGENNREYLKQVATTYLEEKKKNYSGLAYIEQLDKNYVYLDRSILALADHFIMFLIGKAHAPKKDDVDAALTDIRLSVQDESAAHMSYLVFGCNGCDHHSDHIIYQSLRELRLKDMTAYVEEIEFGNYFFQAAQVLSRHCLRSLWDESNRRYRNSFHLDKNWMKSIFYRYVRHTTKAVLNDAPLLNEKGELLNYIVPE